MTDAHRPIVEALAAAAHGLGTSPLDVALSWVRQSPFVVSAITGARTAAQLRALLATQNTTLPAEIISALNDVSDPGISYPDAGLPSH
jgi:aryl-alcohol dehydrogenase-like predicted oxidoreductase